MQQPCPRRSQHVHLARRRHEHRHLVLNVGAPEVGPRRCVGEADADPAAGVLRRDHDPSARNRRGSRWPHVRQPLRGARRTERDPRIPVHPQEDPAGVAVLRDDRARIREDRRARHESRSAHHGLLRAAPRDQPVTAHEDVHFPARAVGRSPVRAPRPALPHAPQPGPVRIAEAHHRVVPGVALEDRPLVGHDLRRQVRRSIGDVVVAVVHEVGRDRSAAHRDLGEPRGHHVVRVVVVDSPLRLVAGIGLGVVGADDDGREPPVELGQQPDQRHPAVLGDRDRGTLRTQRADPRGRVLPEPGERVLPAGGVRIVVVGQVQEDQPDSRSTAQLLHLDLPAPDPQHPEPPVVGGTGHRRERGPGPGLPLRGVLRGRPHIALPGSQEHRGHHRPGTHRYRQIRVHEQDVVVRVRHDLEVRTLRIRGDRRG